MDNKQKILAVMIGILVVVIFVINIIIKKYEREELAPAKETANVTIQKPTAQPEEKQVPADQKPEYEPPLPSGQPLLN